MAAERVRRPKGCDAMPEALEIYSDQFSKYFIDREHDAIELRWLKTTKSMSEAQFREALLRLAAILGRENTPNVLIDVVHFSHESASDFPEWRETNVIPLYNAAGVKRFAFLLPPGSTNSAEMGVQPAVEGSARFPTGYFTTPERAFTWFAEASPVNGR